MTLPSTPPQQRIINWGGGEGRGGSRTGGRALSISDNAILPSFLPPFPPLHSLTQSAIRPSVRSKCQGDQLQLRHLLQIVKCHMSERGRGADQVVRPSLRPSVVRRPPQHARLARARTIQKTLLLPLARRTQRRRRRVVK